MSELPTAKKLIVTNLEEASRKAAQLAELGKPYDESYRIGLLKAGGLKYATHYAECGMGWIWRQWLMGTPAGNIREKVEPFIERGLELRKQSQSYDFLPQHDLFLLHCAIFAADEPQLKKVVEIVADASGDKGEKPLNYGNQSGQGRGELYAAAWCGMMKHWNLGNHEKAVEQSEIIWEAKRDPQLLAAPKSLVQPWLKKDWKGFIRQQEKDFSKLWNRARKDGWTVRSETSGQIVVTTDRYEIGHMWCWAHCGMALLAKRQGVEIAADPLWLPQTNAVKQRAGGPSREDDVSNQRELFGQ